MGTITGEPTAGPPAADLRHRGIYVGVASFVALAALGGSIMLASGEGAPPVDDLEPLGLHDWTLPAAWLFASVAVPWTVVAVLAHRRRRATPIAVLVASGLLVVELVVQIPFVGLNPMQPALAAVALVLGRLAWRDGAPAARATVGDH